jgi:hypothetical protein
VKTKASRFIHVEESVILDVEDEVAEWSVGKVSFENSVQVHIFAPSRTRSVPYPASLM